MRLRPLAQSVTRRLGRITACFRPLAGINAMHGTDYHLKGRSVFAPLRGYIATGAMRRKPLTRSDFRLLTEDSFTIPHIEPKEKNYTPEKHGWSRKDKA